MYKEFTPEELLCAIQTEGDRFVIENDPKVTLVYKMPSDRGPLRKNIMLKSVKMVLSSIESPSPTITNCYYRLCFRMSHPLDTPESRMAKGAIHTLFTHLRTSNRKLRGIELISFQEQEPIPEESRYIKVSVPYKSIGDKKYITVKVTTIDEKTGAINVVSDPEVPDGMILNSELGNYIRPGSTIICNISIYITKHDQHGQFIRFIVKSDIVAIVDSTPIYENLDDRVLEIANKIKNAKQNEVDGKQSGIQDINADVLNGQ